MLGFLFGSQIPVQKLYAVWHFLYYLCIYVNCNGRSVGIVRSRTQTIEFSFYVNCKLYILLNEEWVNDCD
jgi:hypothetical protein